MTDENLKILCQDINNLLSVEYGSNYRIINYDPRPNTGTDIFGITLTVEVRTSDGQLKKAHARKSSNSEILEAIKLQINDNTPILSKHYLPVL